MKKTIDLSFVTEYLMGYECILSCNLLFYIYLLSTDGMFSVVSVEEEKSMLPSRSLHVYRGWVKINWITGVFFYRTGPLLRLGLYANIEP